MTFAEFYGKSTGYISGSIPPIYSPDHVKLIPRCGSDSVYFFDGRYGLERCAAEAREVCKKRGFDGFTINAGARYSDSEIIRKLEVVK